MRPRVVAFVHAETSTGVLQPVEEIAAAARAAARYLVLDCVTSLGGLPVALDAWGVDAAYSGTQKCLSCPPGLSPASFSPRALERVAERRSPVQSWYLDVTLLAGYYGSERVYHHTAPISAIFGLAEGLRIVEEEGMEARAARHRRRGARARLGASRPSASSRWCPRRSGCRCSPRCACRSASSPRGEAALRRRLLERHGIEVGGGLGKLAGTIWRVGLMGENARIESVERLLGALKEELQ